MNSFFILYKAEIAKIISKRAVWIAMAIGLIFVFLMGLTNLSSEGHISYVKSSRDTLSKLEGTEMNDDFFAIKPVENLEKSCNVALGTLDQAITKYKNHKSLWYNAFNQAKELLKEMGVEEPYYNYESHSPIIINKQK